MKLLILFTPLRVQETCSVELIGALFQSLHLLSLPSRSFRPVTQRIRLEHCESHRYSKKIIVLPFAIIKGEVAPLYLRSLRPFRASIDLKAPATQALVALLVYFLISLYLFFALTQCISLMEVKSLGTPNMID